MEISVTILERDVIFDIFNAATDVWKSVPKNHDGDDNDDVSMMIMYSMADLVPWT